MTLYLNYINRAGKKTPTETDHGNLTTKSFLLRSNNVANNTPTAYYKKKNLTLHDNK